MRFVWLTDSHNVTSNGKPSSDDGVRRAIAYADSEAVDAILHTGDIGNDSADNCAWVMAYLRAATTPLLWCNGNHSEEESPVGTPSTAAFEASRCWNMSAPFWHTTTITGDGGEVARVLSLDSNFYADDPDGIENSPYHVPGDRIGVHSTDPSGGYYRQFTTAQLDWVASTLAADSDSDYILVLTHYPPAGKGQIDRTLLADALQADGRPVIILSGHVHPDGKTYTLTSTDGLAEFTVYKCPAMLESHSFTDLQITWSGGTPTVTLAEVHNYTLPLASWTISAPFTVARDLRLLMKL